jgi:hypothetical protein
MILEKNAQKLKMDMKKVEIDAVLNMLKVFKKIPN